MQRTSSASNFRVRNSVAFLCMLAVFIISGVQVAHFDPERILGQTIAQSAHSTDGLCPICYSVPVGHGATTATVHTVCLERGAVVKAVAPSLEGEEPEFHLHIRPPPASA